LVESITGIDSIAIRDSRATPKFQIAARMRVSRHATSNLLVASYTVSSLAQATNE
jgi:hypothetical protein